MVNANQQATNDDCRNEGPSSGGHSRNNRLPAVAEHSVVGAAFLPRDGVSTPQPFSLQSHEMD